MITRKPLENPNTEHVRKQFDLLVIGLPRTGTGYTHMLLRSFGLDVGHEVIRPDGTADWQLSLKPKSKKPYGERALKLFKRGIVIRTARNPRDTIPSFVTKVVLDPTPLKFIMMELNPNLAGLNKLEQCIEIMYLIEKKIDQWKPDFTFKVESSSKDLYDFISQYKKDLCPFNPKCESELKFYNKRTYGIWGPELKELEANLKDKYKRKLNSMCVKHGYPLMYE